MSGSSIAAVVLASAGGRRLPRALDGVAWAGERLVVDPVGGVAASALPAGVRTVRDVADATERAWVLLVREDEVVSPALADAIVAAAAGAPRGYRIPCAVRGFGAVLRPAVATVRLAPRVGTRLGLGLGLTPCLVGPWPIGRLGVALGMDAADTLDAAVEEIEAEASLLAALLAAGGGRPLVGRAVGAALLAWTRLAVAPGRSRARWGRWSLAVIVGYTRVVAYAKLWERRHAEATARP